MHAKNLESLEGFDVVAKLASKWSKRRGVDRADLISAGLIGLIKARETWDPAKASSFDTWAYSKARAEIVSSARKQAHIAGGFMGRNRATAFYRGGADAPAPVVSLDAPLSEDGEARIENTPGESIDPLTVIDRKILAGHFATFLESCSDMERAIWASWESNGGQRDGEDNLAAIGRQCNRSRERVRQVEKALRVKARKYLASKGIDSLIL